MSDNGDENNNDDTTFKVTNTKLYVVIVTLSTEDNVKLTTHINEGFKISVYWNENKAKIGSKKLNKDNYTKVYLGASFQGVKKLFFLVFNDTTVNDDDDDDNDLVNNINNRVLRDSLRKYFCPRVNITNYNVLLDGRNFHDQPIGDQVKKYDEIRKTATGQGDDYTTGCLSDHYQIIVVDLSKQN